MQNNVIIAFIAETLKRLFAKSPKFFNIIKVIAIIVTLITGLPSLLESLGVVLPPSIAVLSSKVVSIASFVALIIAQLTVSDSSNTPPSSLPITGKETK
jgi:hypothetical protein